MPTKPAPMPLPISPKKLSPLANLFNFLLAAASGLGVPSSIKTFFPSTFTIGIHTSFG